MRWLRRLADADLALDRTMIPLGSCTMKLNAAAEMEPITWPGFADLHPFAPDADAAGTLELIADLERWLAELTGYAAVSLQPNAGSQGEFAGPAGHRRLPPHPRRGAPRRLPDPGQRARHQRGVGGDGRACGWSSWPPRPTGDVDLDDLRAKIDRAPRRAGRADDHLPVHARGVRGRGARGLRRGARGGRAGLRRRRQPERAGRGGPAGRVRRRRQPPEPAQDVLHPARRRRARASARSRWPSTWRRSCPGRGSASGPVSAAPHGSPGVLPISVGLPAADGPRRAAPGHPDRRRGGQLRGRPAGGALPGALRGRRRAGRPRVHPRPAGDHQGRPA